MAACCEFAAMIEPRNDIVPLPRTCPLSHWMMTVDLEARIAALPCWRGKVTLEPLHGGLSNTAFVVDDGSERYVARCGGDITVPLRQNLRRGAPRRYRQRQRRCRPNVGPNMIAEAVGAGIVERDE